MGNSKTSGRIIHRRLGRGFARVGRGLVHSGIALVLIAAMGACSKDGGTVQAALTEYQKMELQVLDGLNSLRSDPQAHVAELEAMLARFDGFVYETLSGRRIRTVEGPPAVREAIAVLQNERPQTTYTRNALLDKTARDHQMDQGETGQLGHVGSDNSNPGTRAARYLTFSMLGENIAYGNFDSGQSMDYALFIDDGVADRGHRTNMLEPDFQEVGIACGKHPKYTVMCVINYGTDVRPLP